MKAKNDYLLIKVTEEKTKFAGQSQKPFIKGEVINIGEKVTGTYTKGDIVLVPPHTISKVENDIAIVREVSVWAAE